MRLIGENYHGNIYDIERRVHGAEIAGGTPKQGAKGAHAKPALRMC